MATETPNIPDILELDRWLRRSELDPKGVKEGTEKLVRWSANGPGVQTPLSLVYVHGFSATRQETAPLCDEVAKVLGANLFYTRLRGHGLDGESLGQATEDQWLFDTLESIAIAEKIGQRVVAIGASTGATLLAWLAAEAKLSAAVEALVFLSPNFGPTDRRTEIFNRRFGLRIAKKIVGPLHRWEVRDAIHEKYWTCEFPLEALATMMKCVSGARAAIAENQIHQPVLTLYSRKDKTVLPSRTEATVKSFVHPESELIEVNAVDDGNHHILAGEIMAPNAVLPVRNQIVSYLERLL